MKIKTSELIGPALNWAVVKASGQNADYWLEKYASGDRRCMCESPSIDWSQGGPIIEREGINTFKYNKLDASEHDKWGAHKVVPRKAMDGVEYSAALCLDGPTPLIVVMRVYVASKLGDEVEIPEELA